MSASEKAKDGAARRLAKRVTHGGGIVAFKEARLMAAMLRVALDALKEISGFRNNLNYAATERAMQAEAALAEMDRLAEEA